MSSANNSENGFAIRCENVGYRYGDRDALVDVSLDIETGTRFALLGPNGSGKSTLLKLMATILPPTKGRLEIAGFDVARQPWDVRCQIGVVFQHPALDGQLTVFENLKHHARLYGMSRREYQGRIEQSLARLGLADRAGDLVARLSGGLARRVELAKVMIHRPRVLILDEPSNGLDPGTRRDLWEYLTSLESEGVTLLVATHLMDEAERCHRVAILDRGRRVAYGVPSDLRSEIGADVVTVDASSPDEVQARLARSGVGDIERDGAMLRFPRPTSAETMRELLEGCDERIRSISIARPTLEDVFLRRTGRRFDGVEG